MPQLIEHVDAIARRLGRDVLFVEFGQPDPGSASVAYQDDPSRHALLAWLDANAIAWAPAGAIASETRLDSYRGQIYIGLPYEESDPRYCQLRDHLENPDGTMRDSHVTFYVISLQLANMNVHHDEPGFWERWGENL